MEDLGKKMAEYTQAVVQDKPSFYINMVLDVSPWCDCHAFNDAPIIPNVGMAVSFDPVALDQACSDLCNKMHPVTNSRIGDNLAQGLITSGSIWKDSTPASVWDSQLIHGEKIGLGSREYELVIVK